MRRVVLLSLLAALPHWASPPAATKEGGRLKVPLRVDGAAVERIGAKDLTARLGGASSPVLAVHGPEDDLVVLAVLDLAGDPAFASPAKDALIAGVRKLHSRAWVALLRAQDGLRVLLDPTADRDALAAAIEAVPVSGKAALLDTVETAGRIADAILANSDVRVAVLYITDSDIENYREDFSNPVINRSDSRDLSRRFPEVLVQEKISKMEASLAGRQAPLFIVHLRNYGNRLNEAYRNGLMRLAEVTGGMSVFCRSDVEIPGAVNRALESISSYYSVTVAMPEGRADTLQVQLEHGGGHTLNHRTRFVLKGR
jgi:hypothetical protein